MNDLPNINLEQRGTVWYYSFTVPVEGKPRGERIRRSSHQRDKSQALITAERHLLSLLRGDGGAMNPMKATAEQAFKHFKANRIESGISPSTISNYKRYEDRFTAFFSPHIILSLITKPQLEEWRNWLSRQSINRKKGFEGRTLSKKSVNEHLNWLSAVYRDMDIPNPCKLVRRIKITQADRQEEMAYYTQEEVQSILKRASANCFRMKKTRDGMKRVPMMSNIEVYLVLTVLFYTGCRIGELRNLRYRDIDYEHQAILIKDDKTGKRRTLNLQGIGMDLDGESPDEVSQIYARMGGLGKHLPAMGKFSKPFEAIHQLAMVKSVQKWRDPEPEDPDEEILHRPDPYYYKKLQTICRQAGVPMKGVHATRHTFATRALKKWNIQTLSK